MRIKDWRITFFILILLGSIESLFAGSNKTTPLYVHEDPKVQREFQNVYQTAARSPAIFQGSGAPGFAPQKVGDTYIDTTGIHVYVATATVTNKSWFQTK